MSPLHEDCAEGYPIGLILSVAHREITCKFTLREINIVNGVRLGEEDKLLNILFAC